MLNIVWCLDPEPEPKLFLSRNRNKSLRFHNPGGRGGGIRNYRHNAAKHRRKSPNLIDGPSCIGWDREPMCMMPTGGAKPARRFTIWALPPHIHTLSTGGRVSTEVSFRLPTEYGNFWKTRNSAVFFAVKLPGLPYVFAYGIPHVTKWSRFQISPWIKNKKCWTNCTVFQLSMQKNLSCTIGMYILNQKNHKKYSR